jgi:uncharacterized delta-60 repeat protein
LHTALASKILAAGKTLVAQKGKGGTVTFISKLALARYNANGTLDTTFGTNGKVITAGLVASAMAVDGSGRIVVADSGHLARYTPNGALDTSFGTGGVIITNISSNIGSVVGVVLQPDGKIVLAGSPRDPATSTYQFMTARFNANGTADPTFGSSGVVTTHLGSSDVIGGVTIQGDGKIVVSGAEGQSTSPFALYLLRYNADGSLDANFRTGGTVAVPSPDGQVIHPEGVAVQADGKIIAGGFFQDAARQHMNLAALRVNPDGSVDTGYGNGGWATGQFGNNGAEDRAMALEPDGRLLLAGYAQPNYPNGGTEVALVRFLGSAPQVGSFTASPNPVTAGSSTTLTASNLTDGNPNNSITQVAFYYYDSTGTKQVLGYGTSDGLGNWTLSFTVSLPPGTYTLYAQAQDSYGVFGDPLALTLTVQ